MHHLPKVGDIPAVSLGVVERHNRITGYHGSRRDEDIKALVDENKVTLPPHPPVQLQNPIDWDADPLNQRNWRAQLHMLRWLGLLFWGIDDGDVQAQKRCEEIISSWAEAAFSSKPPRWAWADMVDAVRVLWLLQAYERVSPDYQLFLGRVLYAHGLHLADPKNIGHSNHATWQHQALLVLGEVFNGQTWINLALERIEEAFNTAFTTTYVNVENSPGYHLYNYILWKKVLSRLPQNSPIAETMNQNLTEAARRIVCEIRPDGYLEELGDTDPKQHLKALEGIPEADWVLSQGAKGTPPDETTTILETGFIYSRSGWGENARGFRDEFFYSLRFGEQGVHGHNDLGSLTMYSHGQQLLIDGGKYGYVSDEWRKHFLSRSAHNTLYIPGLAEEQTAYTLTKHHSHPFVDDFTIVGLPYRRVKHERRVIYVKGADALIVIDIMRSPQPRDYTLAWHFNPEAHITRKGKQTDITIDKQDFRLIQLGVYCETNLITNGQERPHLQGWHSPAYNKIAPCPTLTQTRYNTHKARIINIIGPATHNIFKVTTANTNNTLTLHTKAGYFTIDTNCTPATIAYTREHPIRGRHTATRQRTGDSNSGIVKLLDASTPVYPHIASKLRHRLSLITGVDGTVGELLAAAFASPALTETRDYGLRAAVIDLIAAYDGESAANVLRGSPLFRQPLFNSMFIEQENKATDLLCAPKGRSLSALRIIDEHALYWQGMQGNSTLCIRFNGAIDRAHTQLPYCGGATLHANRSESWLIFADPALDRDASAAIAWYLGKTNSGTIYDEINLVVDEYVREWGIERVVFLGTSGGGYAALQVGLRRGDCDVLCINPQTILKHYMAKTYKTAREITHVNENHDALLDATLLLSHPKARTTSIHYVTNPEDHHHKTHFLPFKEMANINQIPLDVIELNLGKGHVAPSSTMISEILTSIL